MGLSSENYTCTYFPLFAFRLNYTVVHESQLQFGAQLQHTSKPADMPGGTL